MSALETIRQSATHPTCHGDQLRADEVLFALDIDVDEGEVVTYYDAMRLALTLHTLAAQVAEMRARMIDAEDVPPVTLRDALEEVQDEPTWEDAREELRSTIKHPLDWQIDDMLDLMRTAREAA